MHERDSVKTLFQHFPPKRKFENIVIAGNPAKKIKKFYNAKCDCDKRGSFK